MDIGVVLAGLVVGVVVGLTGMGGGALLTPLLVLGFGIPPLTAVSSDLVAATFAKPVGGAVHLRRGTVNLRLVLWLVAGSIPAAFVGVYALRSLGDDAVADTVVRRALGVALVGIAATLLYKQLSPRRAELDGPVAVRPLRTLGIGVIGGFIVGLTSVGSGSLIMMLLLIAHPRMRMNQLVGTDLAQAVPLVAAAALAHSLFGDIDWGLTASLVAGAVPGAYIGARWSARAPDHIIRPVLVAALSASGAKLLGLTGAAFAWATAVLVIGAVLAAYVASRRALQPAPASSSPED